MLQSRINRVSGDNLIERNVVLVLHISNRDSESHVNELAMSNIERVKKLFPRLDSIVIGPGAGRNPSMMQTLKGLILYALEIKKPLVLDGDGLWVLTQYPEIFSGIDFKSQNVILTPNQMEFTRLWNRLMNQSRNPSDLTQSDDFVRTLSNAYLTSHIPVVLDSMDPPFFRKARLIAYQTAPACFVTLAKLHCGVVEVREISLLVLQD